MPTGRAHKLIDPVPLLGSVEQLDRPLPSWADDYMSATGVRCARDDLLIVRKYLLRLRKRPETFRAYRRDLESFLHWAWQFPRKRITAVDRDDILGFIDYLEKPPKAWIGPAQVDRHVVVGGTDYHPHLKWRLFVARDTKAVRKRALLGIKTGKSKTTSKSQHTSKAGIRSALSAASWMYWQLIGDQKVKYNPVAALMKAEKNTLKIGKGEYERVLTPPQWKACIDTARAMAESNPAHERTLFMISMLYLLKLRVSEMSDKAATMDRFRVVEEDWIYRVEEGKRGKTRDVACPTAMLTALRRYRKHLGLVPTLPSIGDKAPLLPKFKGRGSLGTREVSALLQMCFDTAARQLVEEKRIDDAFAIVAASAHWLRHTSASSEVRNGRPLIDLQYDLGHDNLQTTSRYVHDDQKRRSESVRHKQL